jgi:site-specific DNA-methyltransferase (adenine-specific)
VQKSDTRRAAAQRRRDPVSVADLVADPTNRRKRTPRNVDMIVAALEQVGASRSIVIDERGEVLAGNGVVEACAQVGITKLQVVEADGDTIIAVRRRGLSDEQKRALAIYDNRTAELAEWNVDQLRADSAAGLDLQPFFFEAELRDLLGLSNVAAGLTDPDALPQARPTDIVVGDLFILGQHRLLCGDSSDADAVAALMDGAEAGLMMTDPPYGVSVAGGTHDPRDAGNYRSGGTVENDGLTGHRLQEFLERCFTVADAHLSKGASWYLFFASSEALAFLNAAVVIGGARQMLVWLKTNFVFGRSDYHYKHEPILYGWTRGGAHTWSGTRDQSSVWEYQQAADAGEIEKKLHPTVKPVGAYLRAIGNHTQPGDVLYEPFAGSGTAIIAAEQTARRCCAVEVAPTYVQLTIDRWEAFTGQKAIKVAAAVSP